MFNIIKYDFKRKLNIYCAVVISAIALNIMFAYLWGIVAVSPFVFVAPFILPWIYIVDAARTFNDELSGKSRYMLFMTPHSGYTIIVAKLIRCILFGMSLIILYAAFASVNGYLLVQETDTYRKAFPDVTKTVTDFLNQYGYRCALYYTLAACVYVITFTLTVFMSQALSKSLLSESRYRSVIALFFFLLVIYCGAQGMHTIVVFCDQTLANYDFYVNASLTDRFIMTTTSPLILALIYCAIITRFTGYLLEKRINL